VGVGGVKCIRSTSEKPKMNIPRARNLCLATLLAFAVNLQAERPTVSMEEDIRAGIDKPVVYNNVTENTGIIRFVLNKPDQHKAYIKPPSSLNGAPRANWTPDEIVIRDKCTPETTNFLFNMIGTDIPPWEAFVVQIKGTLVSCEGSTGGSGGDNTFTYTLKQENGITINPQNIVIGLYDGIRQRLDAVDQNTNTPVNVFWGVLGNPEGVDLATWNSAQPYSVDNPQLVPFSWVYFSSTIPGVYTVKGQRGNDENISNISRITVADVSLEPKSAGNNNLEPGRICINAQVEYKVATWEVVVKPDHLTATVTLATDNIKFVMHDNDSQTVNNGDALFIMHKSDGQLGEYNLKIQLDDNPNIKSEHSEIIFEFVASFEEVEVNGHSQGEGLALPNLYEVYGNSPQGNVNANNGGYLKAQGNMYMETNPAGAFSGNVKASNKVTLETSDQLIQVERHENSFDGKFTFGLEYRAVNVQFEKEIHELAAAGVLQGNLTIAGVALPHHRVEFNNKNLPAFWSGVGVSNFKVKVETIDEIKHSVISNCLYFQTCYYAAHESTSHHGF